MDWHNERYVRLYKRETADDLMLSWEARALWHEMLKKFDRSGILTSRRGAQGLAALVRMPFEIVDRALAELLEDGRIQVTKDADGWVAPNFLDAQEAMKSGALRQKEYRERHRSRAVSQSGNGKSQNVTTSDDALQGVTASDSYPIRSGSLAGSALTRGDVLSRDELKQFERRRVPEDPTLWMLFSEGEHFAGVVRIDAAGSGEVVEAPAQSRAG